MPSVSRKRQLCDTADTTAENLSQPPTKRQKRDSQARHTTPPWFWDNLSKQWLTPRALREFDRRTTQPVVPSPSKTIDPGDYQASQLKRFARQGGPDLSNLRAYPEPGEALSPYRTMSSNQSGLRKRANSTSKSSRSSKSRKSSAYDPGFEQHLADNGILMNNRTSKPGNWREINERLVQPRPSLSPSRFSEGAFESFQEVNDNALTENAVISKVIPVIAGDNNIPSGQNLPFGNLEDLTDGSIVKAQPDLYDGVSPSEIDKQIRGDLGDYIVPSTNHSAPCLPNFFAEKKGPKGSAAVAKRQALYDGALGARAMHQLRSQVDAETAFDNNAYTITSTYHSATGTLKLYASYPTTSTFPTREIEYYMTQLRGWDLTDTPDSFREGASAFRNARDWAREKREELVTIANGRATTADDSVADSTEQNFQSTLLDETVRQGSETSADELSFTTAATSIRKNNNVRRTTRRRGAEFGV